jgi:hypothetical protein
MSISRFLQSLLLALVLPFMAYASAPSSRETGRTPGAPLRTEKFILRYEEAAEPTPSDGPETETKEKAAEKTEAARASEHPVAAIVPKVDLNVAQRPLFSRPAGQLTLIEKTYLDAYHILHESNTCSQFFGGPRISTGVLNSLYPRLKKRTFDYRLFDEVVVNERGPFYQSMKSPARGFFHSVGHFSANTREARVTMLLHELGHLLTDASHKWLLPDDGGDEARSLANTRVFMEKCGAQIKSLSDNH